MAPPRDAPGNIKWVEGLRGLASILVVCTHLARSFDYELFYPSDWDHEHGKAFEQPRLLQLPILRIPWQGRISVTIFAFLTGFVCALKPIKLIRQDNPAGAVWAVSKSAFRRTPRLMLPATIALLIAWTLAQVGGTVAGSRCDSDYIRETSVILRPTLYEELWRLWDNFRMTWTHMSMEYEANQWAMLPLLKGSFIVYLTLVMCAKMRFRYRMLIYVIMYCYFWQDNSQLAETFGMQMYFGMALSDLSQEPWAIKFCSWPKTSMVISPIFIIAGLWVGSYPNCDEERMKSQEWSANLQYYGNEYLFPAGSNFQKRYTALGVDLICLGIWFSPIIKDWLSSRPLLYIGRTSFAVYLTHGITLRTLLVWMVYSITGQPWELVKNEENGNMYPKDYIHPRSSWIFYIAVPIWIGVVYVTAHYWTEYVDTWCDRMVRRLEERVVEPQEKDMSLLPA